MSSFLKQAQELRASLNILPQNSVSDDKQHDSPDESSELCKPI